MAKARISTTIDEALLREARDCCGGVRDSSLMESALRALVAQHRREEIDREYDAYLEKPLSEPDDWGSVAEFLERADKS